MTTEQLTKFQQAMASDPPMITDDPLVNWMVDCAVMKRDGDTPPDYDEDLYLREVERLKKS